MSAAINRAFLLKTRTSPSETVDTGEAYFWLDGTSLKYKDDTQTVHTLSTGVTPEEVQDIIGAFITAGSSKVSVVYNDAGNVLTIDVVPANIDHNALQNYVANRHIDHSAVSITAGTGLSGGGDITASRTLNLANTSVTPGSYGSATQVGAFTVDAQGRLTAASNVNISLASSAITDFNEAAQDAVGGILANTSNISLSYNDVGNSISADLINTSVTPGAYGSATQVGTFTVDAKGRLTAASSTAIAIPSTQITDFNEAAQDAVGNILLDSASIDFTYNDVGNTISAAVLPAGVDHNALQNYVANRHIDHSAVSVNAGTGLTGGGDLTTTRTISMPNVGTAGTYGSASSVPVITTDAQGRVSSAVNTSISILSSAVSDFAAAVRGVALTGLTLVDSEVVATDSILTAIGKLQGQVNVWTEIITTSDVTNSSSFTVTAVTQLAIPVVAGRTYRYEFTAIYESTATTTGFAVSVETPDTAAGNIALAARMIIAGDGTAAEYAGAITSLGDLVIGTGVPATNTRYVCTVIGVFVCTTSGTIQPVIRRETGGGTTVTLRAGSCLLVREFA